jgi:hypothetical protein
MSDEPGVTPVTVPVSEPIVATEVLLLFHVPPNVASLSVLVVPTHIFVVPVIAAGVAYTVTPLVA